MAEESGFELIQGKGNQVRFTGICPECKTFDEKLKSAWVENNSFWERIQCPKCGYNKVVSEIKLVEGDLSGIEATIAIKRELSKLAHERGGNTAVLIWLGKHFLHQSDD